MPLPNIPVKARECQECATCTGAVVIKGRKKYSRITYGIEAYYVPETVREAIERDLRDHIDKARVEVAVGPFGNGVILRLRVGKRVYEY